MAGSRPRRMLAPLAASLGFTVACAQGKQAEAPAPPATEVKAGQGHTSLGDIDALEHDLELAERRLVDQLARQRVASTGPRAAKVLDEGPPASGTAAPAKPEAAPVSPAPSETPQADASELAEPGVPCDLACRALGSMRRSAARICEVAGSGDGRCKGALERVGAAETAVHRAGCACQ